MSNSRNYYEILEVRHDSSKEVINMAYKALAKKYHPDLYAGPIQEANELMQELNLAYETLSDPILRAEYDESLESNSQPNSFNNPLGIEMPMNWFDFYSRIWLPFSAIACIWQLISTFASNDMKAILNSSLPFVTTVFLVLMFIASLLQIFFLIYLFFGFLKKKASAFYVNRIYLIFLPFVLFFNGYLQGIDSKSSFSFKTFLVYIIPSLVFAFLNNIYFEKRKSVLCSYPIIFFSKAHVIKKSIVFSILSIVLIVPVFIFSHIAYGTIDKYDDQIPVSSQVVETETADKEILDNCNKLSQLYGYASFDEMCSAIEKDPNSDLIKGTYRKRFEVLCINYLEAQSYESLFGFINPFNNKIIDSFGKYQEYILDAAENTLNQPT